MNIHHKLEMPNALLASSRVDAAWKWESMEVSSFQQADPYRRENVDLFCQWISDSWMLRLTEIIVNTYELCILVIKLQLLALRVGSQDKKI